VSKAASAARIEATIRVRDIALRIVQARGSFEKAGALRLLTWHHPGFKIALRTPFSGDIDASTSEHDKHRASVLEQPFRNLPYSLDIWAPTKVFSVGWNDAADMDVRGYKPGP
jgi:hypothetical protein